jgi:hypothetical protein
LARSAALLGLLLAALPARAEATLDGPAFTVFERAGVPTAYSPRVPSSSAGWWKARTR